LYSSAASRRFSGDQRERVVKNLFLNSFFYMRQGLLNVEQASGVSALETTFDLRRSDL
jgi:hypothetical protein